MFLQNKTSKSLLIFLFMLTLFFCFPLRNIQDDINDKAALVSVMFDALLIDLESALQDPKVYILVGMLQSDTLCLFGTFRDKV